MAYLTRPERQSIVEEAVKKARAATTTSGGLTDGDKGDITVGGSGTTLTIDADAVTYAKIQNVTDARLLGRSAGSSGDLQEITVGAGLSLAAGALTSTGGVADGDKGDITTSGSGTVWTIDADVVTYAKMQNVSATDKLLGRSTAGAGDVEEIALTAAGRALIDDVDAATQLVTLGATPATRTISTTAPLTGGGDLSANRTFAVSAATTAAVGVVELATDGEVAANVVVQGNDSRNSNARTPTAHVLADTAGLGAQHTTSGLTAGMVLRATAAATAAFQVLADADIPSTIARDTEVDNKIIAHEGLADPHTGYQKESERNANSGYAGLDASANLELARFNSGTGASSSTFWRGDRTWAAPTASIAFTTATVSLGAAPTARRSGSFQITGLSGLTVDKPVYIQQANGPYTGKGTRQDEAEMDAISLTAKVLSATVIQGYWNSRTRARGNYTFMYAVGG